MVDSRETIPLATVDQINHGYTVSMAREQANRLNRDEIHAYDPKTQTAVLSWKGWVRVVTGGA